MEIGEQVMAAETTSSSVLIVLSLFCDVACSWTASEACLGLRPYLQDFAQWLLLALQLLLAMQLAAEVCFAREAILARLQPSKVTLL